MPIDPTSYAAPDEPVHQVLPANWYEAVIKDITYRVSDLPPQYVKEGQDPKSRQFIVQFDVIAPEKYKGVRLTSWINDSLLPQTKTKGKPILPKLLLAVTGQSFTAADRSKVTPEFMNTLIGQELRVNVEPEVKTDTTWNKVTNVDAKIVE